MMHGWLQYLVAWTFTLALTLPTFGGPVTVTVTTSDSASCIKLRRVVLEQIGGERNLRGQAGACLETPSR